MTYSGTHAAVLKALQTNVSAVSAPMMYALDRWAGMYEDRPPWLSAERGIMSAGIPAAICAELARLTTCELSTSVDTGKTGAVYQKLIEDIRSATEQGCALGGAIFKPYLTERGEVVTQMIRADRFVPLAFDSNKRLLDVVFIEQVMRGDDIFTRLEVHARSAGQVLNFAFRRTKNSGNFNAFGVPVFLDSVPQWADIAEVAPMPKDAPTFGYFRIPLANTVDADSALGISVFGRAERLIEEADKKYSNIAWEYDAKQAAVHIAQSMLLKNDAGNFVYPDGRKRLYRALQYNVGATDKPLIDVFSPEIRHESLFAGLQSQFKMIEFACGLAYGTISDPVETTRTATEVRASKQRLYVTVTDIQRALQVALTDTAASIAGLLGESTPDVGFDWGDSVMTDTAAYNAQTLLEYQAGLIDRVEYYKRVYAMTDESAKEMAAEVAARLAQETPDEPDLFGGGGDA